MTIKKRTILIFIFFLVVLALAVLLVISSWDYIRRFPALSQIAMWLNHPIRADF